MRPMLTIVAVCALMMNQWPANEITASAKAPVEVIPYDVDPCPPEAEPFTIDVPTLEAEKVCVNGFCVPKSTAQPVPSATKSVVVKHTQAGCRRCTYATQFGANHPVLTAPVRIPLKGMKAVGVVGKRVGIGMAKVGKAVLGVERRQARRAAGRGLFRCWRCH